MDNQWKKLSGAGNWDGLFKPLDKDLENRLSLCIESIQVIRDSVLRQDKRKPAYQEKDLFSKMKTKEFGKLYTVTHYIYARSDVPSSVNWIVKDKSAWIGYVAVATDDGKERQKFLGKPCDPRVHKGFLSLYTSSNIEPPSYNDLSARDQVLHAVKTLVNNVDYRDEEISITVTGHSLGAALATLSATDIVANKYNRRKGSDKICMVTAFVFGSPKVGDKGFREAFGRLKNLHLLRIKNKMDFVTKVPPKLRHFLAYEKVGIELKVNSWKKVLSKVTKELLEGVPVHSLKQYLAALGSKFHR
ncbi:hypothetical protein Patl1_11411 [Pistacia atlantica]|uniref:Uncharacterized protein n=1 Tax=Pistacia atlantica TaxID=434234 RepID=A0ACC1A8D9_9ROSI|nr:hypothetical protein Patl1_11411 [Pistacia atlantica]